MIVFLPKALCCRQALHWDGQLREAGEGGRGDVWEGVQGARQAHGAAGGAEEDSAGNGGGRRAFDGAARSVVAADALAQHLHRQVLMTCKRGLIDRLVDRFSSNLNV